MGKPAAKAIVFEAAERDDRRTRAKRSASEHISQVQKIVQKQAGSHSKNELKDQKARELEDLKIEVERASRPTADLQMEALRSELEDQSTASARPDPRATREELMDLRPFTFLSETRYRELKQRWGQVFRADMGAEAFYDILRRLDLDKLAEELWHEVRTTKSKQKRKKATKRLQGGGSLPPLGQPARVDDPDRAAGDPARPAPDGAAGRRPLCHLRPERSVPPRDQPQQPPQAPARTGRAGCDRAQREAHAAGSGRLA